MLKLPSLTALARGMSRRSNRVPLLALLLAGVLSAFLTVQLVDARRQQENLARQEARNLAALLEARLLAGIREIDVALRSVSPRLNPVSLRHNPMPANARLVAEHALEQALPLAGFADHLGLMNVRGELIYQTGRHPELLEAMSREYFIRMRDDPGLKFFGTRLLVSSDQRSSGIVLARRVEDAQGEFAGVLLATVDQKAILKLFSSIQVGEHGAVALRDDTMATIARVPQHDANSTVLSTRHPLLNALARGEIGGDYTARSVVDQEARMHAWRLLPGTRYVVLVGVAEQDYLRAWRRMLHAYYAAMSALALLGGAVAWHYRGERRDGRALQASKAQLEASEARFRGMVENLPFPLTITALADRSLLYANTRACRLFGMDAELREQGQRPDPSRFYVDPAERASLFQRLARTEQVDNVELQFQRDNGTQFWALVSAVHLVFDHQPAVLCGFHDISSRKLLEDTLRRQAQTDALTGLANRAHTLERAVQLREAALANGTPLAALMLDIDHFKKVNDTRGHACGDAALHGLASTLEHNLRRHDLIGRLGGEEFAVFLPDTALGQAMQLAERLRMQVAITAMAAPGEPEPIRITISIGLAMLSGQESLESLLARADDALYQAKREGRNRVVQASAPTHAG